jgi:hypothetical protein
VVDRALEQARLDTGAGDPLLDVLHEHVHHRVGHLGTDDGVERGAARAEEEGHLVVGVEPRGDDDVQVHLLGDPLDARDVTAQADDRRVDDRPHAALGELGELAHRVGDPLVLAAPLLGVVLLDVGSEHEDVLVHERGAELGGVDGAAHGLDRGHVASSSGLLRQQVPVLLREGVPVRS